jgi:hypothetical protein
MFPALSALKSAAEADNGGLFPGWTVQTPRCSIRRKLRVDCTAGCHHFANPRLCLSQRLLTLELAVGRPGLSFLFCRKG